MEWPNWHWLYIGGMRDFGNSGEKGVIVGRIGLGRIRGKTRSAERWLERAAAREPDEAAAVPSIDGGGAGGLSGSSPAGIST